jgi:uncharacterized protein YutE (UPF0331/DUF86 family)
MPREVLLRKLAYVRRLLHDLGAFAEASQSEIEVQHYTVERIIELLVAVMSDLLFHMLAERGLQPASYRDAFRQAGAAGLLPIGSGRTIGTGRRDAQYHCAYV